MKISWTTILIVILAIILVMIAFFGGWGAMISYIAPLVGSAQTAVYVALAIVVSICVGIAVLTMINPEWLSEIADAIGYTADKLANSLGEFTKKSMSWLTPVLTVGAVTFCGIVAYKLFRGEAQNTSADEYGDSKSYRIDGEEKSNG